MQMSRKHCCHPERSEAESRDLRLCAVPEGTRNHLCQLTQGSRPGLRLCRAPRSLSLPQTECAANRLLTHLTPSHVKSSPQHTPTQSSSRPCTSNCVANTSKRDEQRTSSSSSRNQFSQSKRRWKSNEGSMPSARNRIAEAEPTSPARVKPRRFWLSQTLAIAKSRVSCGRSARASPIARAPFWS